MPFVRGLHVWRLRPSVLTACLLVAMLYLFGGSGGATARGALPPSQNIPQSQSAACPWSAGCGAGTFTDTHDYSDCSNSSGHCSGAPDSREWGIDVGLSAGTAVFAPEAGTISYAPSCQSNGYLGNWPPGRLTLTVDGGGSIIAFGHVVLAPGVKSGDHVNQGQKIALVGPGIGDPGNNGCSPYYAHIEFMYDGNPAAGTRHANWLPASASPGANSCPHNAFPRGYTGGTSADPCAVLTSFLQGTPPVTSTPLHTAAALIPHDGLSGYALDGYGGLHAFGNAPAVASPVNWGTWDIARAIAVSAPGKGYILDGYGGLHPFGGAPALADPSYWPNWDIARGIALCPSGTGGYVLDGYGGLHPIGNAKPLAGSAYWKNWDIARAIVVNSRCTGGYVLDGFGGIHRFGKAPPVVGEGYWPNWDIARSIVLTTDSSGYVLDGYGGIHPFATSKAAWPPSLTGASYQGGSDVYRALVIDPVGEIGAQIRAYLGRSDHTLGGGQLTTVSPVLAHTAVGLIPHHGVSGYILDGYGGLHAFGRARHVKSPVDWGTWDIARAIAVTGPGKGYILDGYGGLHPFGGAPTLADKTYWKNWDIARGLAICPKGRGGYVLDGFGGIHPVGKAKARAGSAYWKNWDIARAIVVNSRCTGGYVLDGFGGIHRFGKAPAVVGEGYWANWDIARSIVLTSNSAGYVLDGYGGIHPFATSQAKWPTALANPLYDPATTDPFDALAFSVSAHAGVAVTKSTAARQFWAAPAH